MNPEPPEHLSPPARPLRAMLRNLAGGARAALLLRVRAGTFDFGAGRFVAIAVASIALSVAASWLLAGAGATFDDRALPSAAWWIPLALLAGYLSAHATLDPRHVTLVPVVAGSIGIAFALLSGATWFAWERGWLGGVLSADGIYRTLSAWWALATWLAVRRIAGPARPRGVSAAWILALVYLLPVYLLPPEPLWIAPVDAEDSASGVAFSEEALYTQTALLDDAEERLLPQRPGVEDLYFVGFAPFANQDVFMKETLAIGRLMDERFGTAGRSISLISHPKLLDRYPIATLSSLRDALQAVGERIDPQEDVVMVHLTSHGSRDQELSVEFPPLDLSPINAADLRAALDDAGIKWRIIVVSACYSGGFINALKDPFTMVVTASDASHTSFGCGNLFDYTYFSQAFYDLALRRTRDLEEAFAIARESIAVREKGEGLEPSNPQLYVGAAIRDKLSRMARNGFGASGNAI